MTTPTAPPSPDDDARRKIQLGRRAKKGVAWVYTEYGITLALSFFSLVILARILTPNDFGVFGVASLLCGASILFKLGLGPSVIQAKELKEHRLQVAWTANLVMSVISVTILAAIAPYVTARITDTPEALTVSWLLLLTIIIDALASPALPLNQRYMENRKLFLVGISQPVVRYGTSILIAFYMPNYWSLAIGLLLGSVARTAVSYTVSFNPVIFYLRKDIFLEMFAFSGWLQLNNLIRWLSRYADSSIVAAQLGTSTLGLYNRARALAEIPEQFQQLLAGRILFPMFSSAQSEYLRTEYLAARAYALVITTSVPLVTLTWSFGDQLIGLVLGHQWIEITETFMILALALAIQAVNTVAGSLLRGNGHSREEFFLGTLRVVVTMTTLYPFVSAYQITGAAFSVLAGTGVAMFASLILLRYRLGIGAASWFGNFATSGLAGYGSILVSSYIFPSTDEITTLALLLGIASQLLVFVASLLVLGAVFRQGPGHYAIEQITARRFDR